MYRTNSVGRAGDNSPVSVLDDIGTGHYKGRKVKRLAERINVELGGAAVSLAPLLAPIGSAVAVFYALPWGWGWNGLVALAVETLSFAAAHTWLRAYRKRQHDDSLTSISRISGVMFGACIVAVYIVLAAFHGWHPVLALPALSIVGAVVYGINTQLDAIDAEPEKQIELDDRRLRLRDQRAAERKRLQAEVSQQVSQSVSSKTVSPEVDVSQADILRQLEQTMRDNPAVGLRPLGKAAGISKDKAKRIVTEAGWHKNGDGWELTE